MKTKIKALLLAGILTASAATPVFAMDAQHGCKTWRTGPYCCAFAFTRWDRSHTTKVNVGWNSETALGTSYSQTKQISGVGHATSSYWAN